MKLPTGSMANFTVLEALLYFPVSATVVTIPTLLVLTVNGGDMVWPAGTVTDTSGCASAELLVSRTAAAPGGAGPFNVTVLFVSGKPPETIAEDRLTAITAGSVMVSIPVALVLPQVAVKVSAVLALTELVVIVNGVNTVAPSATVREAGNEAAVG